MHQADDWPLNELFLTPLDKGKAIYLMTQKFPNKELFDNFSKGSFTINSQVQVEVLCELQLTGHNPYSDIIHIIDNLDNKAELKNLEKTFQMESTHPDEKSKNEKQMSPKQLAKKFKKIGPESYKLIGRIYLLSVTTKKTKCYIIYLGYSSTRFHALFAVNWNLNYPIFSMQLGKK
ncbi:MAG: hypothetical protein HC905_07245 [Bacteroidales bacterium]|nr:hypothetical protein [Bacteroidales bacterium]